MNKKNDNNWKKLINALAEGVVIINKEGEIRFVNTYAANLLGHGCTELTGSNFLYPLSADETQEIEVLKPSGEILSVQMNVKEGAWENAFAWVVSLKDISEFKAKEKMLSISSKGISSAFEGIIITDEKGTILEVNKAFLKMTGFNEVEIIGKNPRVWKSGYQSADFYKRLWKTLLKEGHWSGELWDKYKNNKLYPVFLSISAVKNSEDEISNYIGFFHDLTEFKAQEKQIEHFKLYDYLTGLPNKLLLTQKLDNYIDEMFETKKKLILMSIRVFDSLKGHASYSEEAEVRDIIILEALDRIKQVSSGKKLVSRIGYSEFVLVFLDHQTIERMESEAKSVISVVSKPYKIKGKSYTLQSIIGVTFTTKNSLVSAEDLLNQAEIARHKAMQKGFNQFDFFDAESEKQVLAFHQHIEALRQAIHHDQLRLYYQPKIDLDSGKVIGIEALLRWIHPDKGLLTPDQFLRGTDNHDVSLELGKWVLEEALKQLDKLIKNKSNIAVSVNISSFQLQDKYFIRRLEKILSKFPNLPDFSLVLEILETEALDDLLRVSKIIKICREKGILFSLDDFGTGYSSLTYLKELNTSEVKLDQSFIRNVLSSPQDLSILKTTIELCQLIDRDLVAEGVETMIHGKLLHHLGCTFVQGYAIAKPMPAEELMLWLKEWKFDPKWQQNRFTKESLDELIFLAIQNYHSFQNLHRYIERNQPTISEFSFEQCPISHWLIKNKKGLKDEKTFLNLYHLHEKQNVLANKICHLKAREKIEQAREELKKLDEFLGMLLKKLIMAVFES